MNNDLAKFFLMVFALIVVVGIFIVYSIRNVSERKAQVEAYCRQYAEQVVMDEQKTEEEEKKKEEEPKEPQEPQEPQESPEPQEPQEPEEGDSEGVTFEPEEVEKVYNECMEQNWDFAKATAQPIPIPQ